METRGAGMRHREHGVSTKHKMGTAIKSLVHEIISLSGVVRSFVPRNGDRDDASLMDDAALPFAE
jgi:hypothetical protein